VRTGREPRAPPQLTASSIPSVCVFLGLLLGGERADQLIVACFQQRTPEPPFPSVDYALLAPAPVIGVEHVEVAALGHEVGDEALARIVVDRLALKDRVVDARQRARLGRAGLFLRVPGMVISRSR
jgi:hypothetical protein